MNNFYKVISVKHNGTEKIGFNLDRPYGVNDFLFLHFKTPVYFTLNNAEQHILPDTCIIISPKTKHHFEARESALIHNWMHFIPIDEKIFTAFQLPIDTFFYPSKTHFITSSFKICESEVLNKEIHWEESTSSILSNVFILLKRQLLLEETILTKKCILGCYDDFKKLRLDIHRNISDNWTVDTMAKKVSLSRSRFSVLYKTIFNISPKDDLISARISRAKYLLSSNNLSLTEISEMCGYTNIYHFIRQFKSIAGITPGTYKKI